MNAGNRTPFWLWSLGGIFVVAMLGILVASLRRPEPPVYALSRPGVGEPPVQGSGPDTVTLDARSGERWLLFDLERRAVTTDPAAWDVGVKRHRLIVNGGAGFLGDGSVRRIARQDPAGWTSVGDFETSRVTGGGDTINAVLDDWYSYSFFSHLLQPSPATAFELRTAEGNRALLRILSYYCPGPEPGCMTLEYEFPLEENE